MLDPSQPALSQPRATAGDVSLRLALVNDSADHICDDRLHQMFQEFPMTASQCVKRCSQMPSTATVRHRAFTCRPVGESSPDGCGATLLLIILLLSNHGDLPKTAVQLRDLPWLLTKPLNGMTIRAHDQPKS